MTHMYSYFTLIATVVFSIAFWILWLKAEFNQRKGVLFLIGAILCFVVGSRITHFVTNLDLYKSGSYSITMMELRGFSLYGGIVLTVVYGYIFSKLTSLNFWKLGDVLCGSFAAGFIPMRLGCYYNGCCFGKPFNGIWSKTYGFMSFSHLVQFEKYNNILPKSVHPTQIYEILIVILASAWGYKQHKLQDESGAFSLNFALIFTLGRFINLLLREPLPSSNYHPAMAVLYVVVLCIVGLMLNKRKKKRSKLLKSA